MYGTTPAPTAPTRSLGLWQLVTGVVAAAAAVATLASLQPHHGTQLWASVTASPTTSSKVVLEAGARALPSTQRTPNVYAAPRAPQGQQAPQRAAATELPSSPVALQPTADWGSTLLGASLFTAVAAVAAFFHQKSVGPRQQPIRVPLQSVQTAHRPTRVELLNEFRMAMCAVTGNKAGEIDGAAAVNSLEANQLAIEAMVEGMNFKKKITLLGSTGSIGTQTLDIVETCPQHYSIVGLAAGANVELLVEQCIKFKPQIVAIRDESKFEELKSKLTAAGVEAEVHCGEAGIVECAKFGDADTVVTGIVGCAGLLPTVAAIEAGKDIALANKETLIAAGPVVLPLLKKHGVKCLPADSEHSAIFQSLQGGPPDGLSKIILTASGGAFRDWDAEDLHKVTVEDALQHPNWSMGAKITIDSATLMNKGLEVIEAHYLFGKGYDDIDVVVHPQSIIHSMVEYKDTSVIAQLGWPDMRLPLVYSMSWPHRVKMPYERLDFVKVGQLTFKAPDLKKYPCLALAYRAGRTAGTMPCALNAANEQAVELFRLKKIHYLDIPKVIEAVMDDHERDLKQEPVLEDIVNVDAWARKRAQELYDAGKFNNVY